MHLEEKIILKNMNYQNDSRRGKNNTALYL